MRTSKSILLMAVVLCLSLLWPLSAGYCSETIGQPQTQTIEQDSTLSRLQINNEKQKQKLQLLEKELIQLSSQLQISQTATAEARQSLTELQTANNQLRQESQTLKNQLSASQTSLTESQKQVSELKLILNQQKQQINQLQERLIGLSSSAENAENSIQAANQSLQQAREEMLAAQKAHEKTEKKLRTQKTLWQILAIGLGAWGALK